MTKPAFGSSLLLPLSDSLNADFRSATGDVLHWELVQQCFQPLTNIIETTYWELFSEVVEYGDEL